MMIAKIEGKKLIVEIDMQESTRSASGKTLVVASTHGNMVSQATVNGKPVIR